MNEKHSVQRAGQRNLQAFTVLMQQNEQRVYTMALHTTGMEQDAAMLTQEIFLRAWHSITDLGSDDELRVRLFRIAVDGCTDHSGLGQCQAQTSTCIASHTGDTPCSATQGEIAAQGGMVAATLGALHEEHRQVILLRDVAGLSDTQMAQVLEMEEQMVKSRLSCARMVLQTMLSARQLEAMYHVLRTPVEMPVWLHERMVEQLCEQAYEQVVCPEQPRRLPWLGIGATVLAVTVAAIALRGGVGMLVVGNTPHRTMVQAATTGGSTDAPTKDAENGVMAYDTPQDRVALAGVCPALPDSLAGVRVACCYVAYGVAALPDLGREPIVTGEQGYYLLLPNSMIENAIAAMERAGYTLQAYEPTGLTFDSKAEQWMLIVSCPTS